MSRKSGGESNGRTGAFHRGTGGAHPADGAGSIIIFAKGKGSSARTFVRDRTPFLIRRVNHKRCLCIIAIQLFNATATALNCISQICCLNVALISCLAIKTVPAGTAYCALPSAALVHCLLWLQISARMASPIAVQPRQVQPSLMLSAVRRPLSSTLFTAFSMASASSVMPKE